MDKTKYLRFIGDFYCKCSSLAGKKAANYANYADPFYNFRAEANGLFAMRDRIKTLDDAMEAVLVLHMIQKTSRATNMVGECEPCNGEGKLDTCMDESNYSAILATWLAREEA